MRRLLLFIVFLIFTVSLKAQEKQIVVPYTLADRDRAINTIARMDALEARMDGFESKLESLESKIDKRMDRLEDKFMWGFALLLVSIFGLIGFIIYDRRTMVAPLESKTERILKSLKEAAEKDTNLREALKKTMLW